MALLDVFIGLISGIASVRWWIDSLRVWQKRKGGDNKSNKKRYNYGFILNEWIHVSSFPCPPSLFVLVADPEEAKNAAGQHVSA
jgi:hypothetical protein